MPVHGWRLEWILTDVIYLLNKLEGKWFGREKRTLLIDIGKDTFASINMKTTSSEKFKPLWLLPECGRDLSLLSNTHSPLLSIVKEPQSLTGCVAAWNKGYISQWDSILLQKSILFLSFTCWLKLDKQLGHEVIWEMAPPAQGQNRKIYIIIYNLYYYNIYYIIKSLYTPPTPDWTVSGSDSRTMFVSLLLSAESYCTELKYNTLSYLETIYTHTHEHICKYTYLKPYI